MTRRTHFAGTRCAARLKAPELAVTPTCPRCRRAADVATWVNENDQREKAGRLLRRHYPDADLAEVARCLVAIARAHPDEFERERVLLSIGGGR